MRKSYVRGRRGNLIERVLPETPIDAARLKLADRELDENVHGNHSMADLNEDDDDDGEADSE